MSGARRLGSPWKAWPSDYGLGFSRTGPGDLRCDLAPDRDPAVSPGGGLTVWVATVWSGRDRANHVASIVRANHWEAAAAVDEFMELHADGRVATPLDVRRS